MRRAIVVAAAVAGLCHPTISLFAGPFRTVALSGRPAIGGGGSVYNNFERPTLDDTGATAFSASLAGPGVTQLNEAALWSEGSGQLAMVVRGGDSVPGATGEVFSLPGMPQLRGDGRTAFRTEIRGPGIRVAHWIAESDRLMEVAREGQLAPGASGDPFSMIYSALHSDVEHTAFGGLLASGASGIWTYEDGVLSATVISGDQAKGLPNGVTFRSFSADSLNDSGAVVFVGHVQGPGISFFNDGGIWSAKEGVVTPVILEGEAAPGMPSETTFINFTPLASNNWGQVAFIGSVTGPSIASTGDSGIWSSGSGVLSLVAREGENPPGVSAGVRYGSLPSGLDRPLINNAGKILFNAPLIGDDVDQSNDRAIWSDAAGPLKLVAREGQQAPGAEAGVNFNRLGLSSINDSGLIAFQASLSVLGSPELSRTSLWRTDANGDPHLLIQGGDEIEVTPGEFRTVVEVSFHNQTGNGDGRPSGFNKLGQIAFRAAFSDGSTGLFVSSPAPDAAHSADFDGDGDVDGGDFLVWQRGYGIASLQRSGDADHNGVVNSDDLLVWKSQYGGNEPTAHQVPEPNTWFAVTLAVACVTCRWRKFAAGERGR